MFFFRTIFRLLCQEKSEREIKMDNSFWLRLSFFLFSFNSYFHAKIFYFFFPPLAVVSQKFLIGRNKTEPKKKKKKKKCGKIDFSTGKLCTECMTVCFFCWVVLLFFYIFAVSFRDFSKIKKRERKKRRKCNQRMGKKWMIKKESCFFKTV